MTADGNRGGWCSVHAQNLPCRTCGTAAQSPLLQSPWSSPFGVPRPMTIVTTRPVPLPGGVCGRRGSVPELPDEPEGEWLECKPCAGKGWLMVTETTTTRG